MKPADEIRHVIITLMPTDPPLSNRGISIIWSVMPSDWLAMSEPGQKRPVWVFPENVCCCSNNGLSQQLQCTLKAHFPAIEEAELANRIEQLQTRQAR